MADLTSLFEGDAPVSGASPAEGRAATSGHSMSDRAAPASGEGNRMEVSHSPPPLPVDPAEALLLGAQDGDFFAHFFFPTTARQESAPFHLKLWDHLDNPAIRYLAFVLFRDSAKTSIVRMATARRISYGTSRTIFYVGKSDNHARRSIEWLKRRVETNRLWASAFGLLRGSKWSEHEIEIINERYGIASRIIGAGVESAIRGINVDDFRPDFIILDDAVSEANTGTPLQVMKTNELIFGALKDTLAPESDAPNAKIVMLNTPQAISDATQQAKIDSMWTVVEQGVFTPDGKSVWPSRWPTEVLQREKQSAVDRGMLHLWLREKECTLHTPEGAAFNIANVRWYDELPEKGVTLIGIDPTPPPSESDTAIVRRKLDDFAITVWRITRDGDYLVESWTAKAPQPEEWLYALFQMAQRWRPLQVSVETIAGQRMVKYAIEEHMKRTRQYFSLKAVEDRRKKSIRIADTYGPRLSIGRIHLNKSQVEFIQQLSLYQAYVENQKDDLLDSGAIALSSLPVGAENIMEGEYAILEDTEALPDWRWAP